ncbi:MAG: eukaryotic-like serine/threonine-protein kinase [Solirubrobacterales bacterium]|nr:eukaryotic-like serine/threonine-protein kinase [Solirubrobacterales bacterium]
MADDDQQPTDELDAERGGRAPAGLAEPPLITSGRRLGGRYLLDRRLGHGGMAVVWLATDERLGREVAVKVLSDTLTADHDYLGRFRREAQVAAGLQHPNLVSVYDYDAGERPYLVMEYIEGGDLAAATEAGAIPPAGLIARELLSALRHIHSAGILHRDIKPANVLIDSYGHARLSDFGIARPRDATALTSTGQVIGTERYLAPELMEGEPASERSDLYALGVMLADLGGMEYGEARLADRLRDPDPAVRPASASLALAELERADAAAPAGAATQPYAVEPPAAAAAAGGRPFEPTIATRVERRRSRVPELAALCLSVVAAVALALILAGGGGDNGGASPAANHDHAQGSSGGSGHPSGGAGSTSQQATTSEPTTTSSTTTDASGGTPAPAGDDGAALNDQGFALVQQGDYAGAIPVLEKAVGLLRDSGDQTTYNYALYNLATAYLSAGRPEDAIPLLEQRMQFDDGQLDEVQRTLDEAYQAAGQKPPKPEKPPKPGKGPKDGHVPPPFEDGE